jgi:hypothetical protein
MKLAILPSRHLAISPSRHLAISPSRHLAISSGRGENRPNGLTFHANLFTTENK